ncbi:right-handed parallel beta-helix repeat-containing protein [Mucilaginibacter sp.]|uniref:right-handed parallel beta-helix repeat-containing protein n=1 Tax=Mucilaginibacter sp. TaxID=1882438 RepID=UPI0032667F19
MGKKNHFMRLSAFLLIASSCAMCTKIDNKIDVLQNAKKLAVVADATTEILSNFTYTVKPNEWFVDGTDIPPGAVVCIPAGTRGALLLKNFKGTAASPIVIVNKGGKVTLSTSITASYGFKTINCQYFKIMGNGDPANKYGIDVNGGNIGMTIDDLSSDFEIANVEVRNSGFAGIMAKTDPSCDLETQRGHFTMSNIFIHDNYVHKTGGEGFYIGNSFYAEGRSLSCGTVMPHDVVNLKVYNNFTDSTGCEGIQVGSAIAGAEIYSNTVKSPGLTPFASGQNNGIQIGEGTGGKCYSNFVKNAPGNGIIVLGLGDNLVCNNIIINSGAHGIYADSRYTPGPNFQFINNTIISPALDGIKLNSESIPMNTVINNVIVVPGAGVAINATSRRVKTLILKNFTGKNINGCKFVNYSADDYRLQANSPLINDGINVLLYGVSTDYYGAIRPLGGFFDIGAAEH